MPIDMVSHRLSAKEQQRITNVLELVPSDCASALEIGARDCYITRRLTEVVEHVTALDLQKPEIVHEHIVPVQGDVTALEFSESAFDIVVCTEVLEHIQPRLLQKACQELARVAVRYVLIGVPYRQDTRVGRTKCQVCGKRNPPWGHLNVFDERRLAQLFQSLRVERTCFIGQNRERTNFLSAWLMNMAGNPYGTYHQEERCTFCNSQLERPREHTLVQRLLTKAASQIRHAQSPFIRSRPGWLHVLFRKH